MRKIWVLYVLYIDNDSYYEDGVEAVYEELPSIDHLKDEYGMTEEKARELLNDFSCDAGNRSDSGPHSYHFRSVNLYERV